VEESENDVSWRIMFTVHKGLPREGPGNRESTARALGLIDDLPAAPDVLDIGCGPGMQTVDLAALLPSARIRAVDAHAPFLADGARRAEAAGCADRIEFNVGDMRALEFAPKTFDLLWCEGAAYIMGIAEALIAWRPLLKTGGCLAFTEAVWLTEDPPQTLFEWWQAEYPAMADAQATLDKVTNAGYELLGHFVLPEVAWWDDYYKPMEARIAALRVELEGDEPGLAALEEHQREIDYYRRWSRHYGYLFVVARLSS
jgi:SAM-dependent methyltransferase